MKQWFSFDPYDGGFELHDTEREAQDRADKGLEAERDNASDGGWNEEVTQICWGKLSQAIVEIERRPIAEDELGFGEYDEYVDYALADFPEVTNGEDRNMGSI